ncbi:PF11855 domain protein [Leptospira interrogans serovar Bataviae str. HAI135]|nr:PF11855 domain protein [Leptospira interrogans serovar Bataviae str. HAI135]
MEGNFTEITKFIHKKYLEVVQKGEILQFALDGDEELLQSEQGKSFQAFWDFLRSEQSQENFESILDSLYSLKDILVLDDRKFFRNFKRNLREAGSRINTVVSRMSEQLKKSLVERTLRDNRRSKAIISEIKHLVLERKFDLSEENFYSMEEIFVHLPMDRPLWKGDSADTPRSIQISGPDDEMISLDFLDSIRGINFEIYEQRIQTLLRSFPEVSLEKVLEEFPENNGFESIVAYVFIASKGEYHSLDDSESFLFYPAFNFTQKETQSVYRVPKATYRVGKDG